MSRCSPASDCASTWSAFSNEGIVAGQPKHHPEDPPGPRPRARYRPHRLGRSARARSARAPRVAKIDAFRDRVAELIALLLGLAHSTVACSTPVDPLRARLRLLILWDRTLRRCSSERPLFWLLPPSPTRSLRILIGTS